jgi:hypothetical protein
MLKIFSVSCLNLYFVTFSLLVKKREKNMGKLGRERFTFSTKKYGKIRLKASIFFNREKHFLSLKDQCMICD